MLDVVALGELLIDFTCQNVDGSGYPTMAAHPGGAPANFLAALAKFGGKTALLGKVGADTFGNMLIGTLEGAGIETGGVVRSVDVFTTLAFVTLDQSGDREFSFARKPGADTCITAEELKLELIDRTKVFHFGTLSLTDEPARSATRRATSIRKHPVFPSKIQQPNRVAARVLMTTWGSTFCETGIPNATAWAVTSRRRASQSFKSHLSPLPGSAHSSPSDRPTAPFSPPTVFPAAPAPPAAPPMPHSRWPVPLFPS